MEGVTGGALCSGRRGRRSNFLGTVFDLATCRYGTSKPHPPRSLLGNGPARLAGSFLCDRRPTLAAFFSERFSACRLVEPSSSKPPCPPLLGSSPAAATVGLFLGIGGDAERARELGWTGFDFGHHHGGGDVPPLPPLGLQILQISPNAVVRHGRGDPGCSCCRSRSVMRNTRCFRAKASDEGPISAAVCRLCDKPVPKAS